MDNQDYFFTIKSTGESLFKDRGSKFHGYAFPAENTDQVNYCLEKLKELHPKARHHCFAYRIGPDGNQFRANDAGEPSGSAGKPLLGQIDKNNLTDILIVVVRYFGGTKLGIPGLINAYRIAAANAIEHLEIIKKLIGVDYSISCDYSISPRIVESLNRSGAEIKNIAYEAEVNLLFALPMSNHKNLIISILKAATGYNFSSVKEYESEFAIKVILKPES